MLKVRPLHLDSLIDLGTENHAEWAKADPVFRGGELTPLWLLSAYTQGFYPLYFGAGEEIYWWSPDPRMVLKLEDFYLTSRFKRTLKANPFTFTLNACPREVITACAEASRPRQEAGETWIYPEIIDAYEHLAELGYMHSVEVWQNGELVGGLYGLALGKIFFGESMFSRISGASRAGFAYLVEILRDQGFWLVDCQQESEYLSSMGAKPIPREQFLDWLSRNQDHL